MSGEKVLGWSRDKEGKGRDDCQSKGRPRSVEGDEVGGSVCRATRQIRRVWLSGGDNIDDIPVERRVGEVE